MKPSILPLLASMAALGAQLPPSAPATPVIGADRNRGFCDCTTPRPNRRSRCQSCYRDVQPEPPMGVRPGFDGCPYYEPLEIVSGDLMEPDETGEQRASFVLKHPESGDCWAIQAQPKRFPVGWWTMRVPGGSSDGAFAQLVNPVESRENLVAFARVLQGLSVERAATEQGSASQQAQVEQPETP